CDPGCCSDDVLPATGNGSTGPGPDGKR
ncbi:pilin, partial [Escherichia coli EC1865]